MIKEIAYEFKKLSKEFMITVMLGLLLMVGMNAYSQTNSSWELSVDMWTFGLDLFGFILPLFVSIPFCFKVFFEIKDGYLKNMFNRVNIQHYLKIKFLAGAVASYLSIFLILFISFLICMYLIPVTPANLNNPYDSIYGVFDTMRYKAPFIYGLFLSVWMPVIGVLFYTITFNLAFITRNIFVVLTGAFIYSIVENFISAVLGIPQISIITAQYATRSYMAQIHGIMTPLIGVGICLLFIAGLTYYKKKSDLFN